MSSKLSIERLGGLAGFGMPKSHLKSEGTVFLDALSKEERKALEARFNGDVPGPSAGADSFRYKITRESPGGVQSIVLDEEDVPEIIRNAVRDVLR